MDFTADLVSRGLAERALMEGARARLADIESQLINMSPGKYPGAQPGEQAQVIQPCATIKPTPQAIETTRELVDEDQFKKLFVRVVTHKPVKGFRDVVKALFTKAKAAKVAALCEVPSAPYVLWK